MREPYRDVEELGEVRKHRAVEGVRRGPEEEGIVAEQDGQCLQVPEGARKGYPLRFNLHH